MTKENSRQSSHSWAPESRSCSGALVAPEWGHWSTAFSVIFVCICAVRVDGTAWGPALAAWTRFQQRQETSLRKSNRLYLRRRKSADRIRLPVGLEPSALELVSRTLRKKQEENQTNTLTLKESWEHGEKSGDWVLPLSTHGVSADRTWEAKRWSFVYHFWDLSNIDLVPAVVQCNGKAATRKENAFKQEFICTFQASVCPSTVRHNEYYLSLFLQLQRTKMPLPNSPWLIMLKRKVGMNGSIHQAKRSQQQRALCVLCTLVSTFNTLLHTVYLYAVQLCLCNPILYRCVCICSSETSSSQSWSDAP